VIVNEDVGDEADQVVFEKLNRLIVSRPFEVNVARTFSLKQAGEAHRALNGHYLGKRALRPADG
jgi:hypothetical protein